jgi:hypothetical protein
MELSQILHIGQTVQFSQIAGHDNPVPDGEVVTISGDLFTVRLFPGSSPGRLKELANRAITMSWEENGIEHECPAIIRHLAGDLLHLRVEFSERREFQRVLSRLPLVYEEIADHTVDAVFDRMMNENPDRDDLDIEVDSYWRSEDVASRIDEQFHQMTRFMDQVNSKLEYLIALSEGRQSPRPAAHHVELASISGAGLSFLDEKLLPVNTHLKMRVQISRFPLREISCIGRVARSCRFENGLHDIGVRFERIHDNDRERVFRLISRIERKMLRDRKEMAAKQD